MDNVVEELDLDDLDDEIADELSEYRQNFENCDAIFDGRISETLESTFSSPAGKTAAVTGLSIILASIAAFNLA